MMSEVMSEFPQTPAALFDQLHKWFGVGDYDDLIHDQPWHRARIIEIGKLKRMLKSRRASLAEVYIAAAYARRTNKPVHSTWQVFALIPEAMRDRSEAMRKAKSAAAWVDLTEAVYEALDAGEHEWADRLMRAEDHAKAIAEWRSR